MSQIDEEEKLLGQRPMNEWGEKELHSAFVRYLHYGWTQTPHKDRAGWIAAEISRREQKLAASSSTALSRWAIAIATLALLLNIIQVCIALFH